MNQILLKNLLRYPTTLSGIFLINHWILNFISHLAEVSISCIVPLICSWLGSLLINSECLGNQIFSLTEIIYLSTLFGIIPKARISARLWFEAHFITVLCFILYYTECYLLAHFNLELEYCLSWLFSILFSTLLTFLCYVILLRLKLSTHPYFKSIIKIYLLADAGNILALGMISPYLSYKFLTIMSIAMIFYLLLPKGPKILCANWEEFHLKIKENFAILRCVFLGVLSVWTDYVAVTPFYILEMVIASESHRLKGSLLYFCKNIRIEQKFPMNFNIRIMAQCV